MTIALVVVVFVILAVAAYLLPIKWARNLAAENKLFFSPKKGRIVARVRGGRIIEYFGNIFDQHKYAVKETGEIKDILLNAKSEEIGPDEYLSKVKDELKNSLSWQWLGVLWLGMDSLFKYMFSKDIEAESVYLKNIRHLTVSDLRTSEMSKVGLDIIYDLETTHAGKSLNYEGGSWITKIEAAITGTCKEYASLISYNDMAQEQIEYGTARITDEKIDPAEELKAEEMLSPKEKEMSDEREKKIDNTLLGRIASLNKERKGNAGLPESVGQRIIGFHVVGIKVESKMEELSQKTINAKKEAEVINIKAEGDAKALKASSEAEANAIKAVGDARNKVLKETAGIVTAERAADIEIAERMAEAFKKTKMQALSFGNGGVPFILNGKETPAPEEKNKKGK